MLPVRALLVAVSVLAVVMMIPEDAGDLAQASSSLLSMPLWTGSIGYRPCIDSDREWKAARV